MNAFIKFLHVVHSWYWWNVRMRIVEDVQAIRARRNYRRTLPQVRARIAKRGRIRVVFPIYDLAKWKSQKVLELMMRSPVFEPVIAMTAADTDWAAPKDIVAKKHELMREKFSALGLACHEMYDSATNRAGSLESLEPDVVFYSQPWGYDDNQTPLSVSRYALTCYVPYFVPNYGWAKMDCKPIFHRSVFAYFILNEDWANYFRANVPKWRRACEYVATGHPGLDYFADVGMNSDAAGEGYVIYAPHWSIPHPNNPNTENYSTFLDTGRPMLEYAKAHPEVKWAFKPHPTLKVTLITTGAWTRDEVEGYFAEWERIGLACYTGDYQELFLKSKLLITDCGSFLSEYGSTGRPIVRIVSPCCKIKMLDFNRRLYETYYNVVGWTELKTTLKTVLERGEDPRRAERLAAVAQSGLTNSHAAEQIVKYLERELRVES